MNRKIKKHHVERAMTYSVRKDFVRALKQKARICEIEIEVKYIPFPDEETRLEAYYTHARLFLKAKERQLMLKMVSV